MQNFENIEKLWAKYSIDVEISANQMLKQAKKEVNSIQTKSTLTIIGMILAIVCIIVLWLFINFQSIFTHIGLSIIILTILIYTYILYNNHRILIQNDFTENPSIFLNKLKNYQAKRQQLYSKLFWFYVAGITLGLGLYFIEVLSNMTEFEKTVAIFLSFGWIIFCSTYLRKLILTKEKAKISSLIKQFENLSQQFNN